MVLSIYDDYFTDFEFLVISPKHHRKRAKKGGVFLVLLQSNLLNYVHFSLYLK